jgi:hypothetical protein
MVTMMMQIMVVMMLMISMMMMMIMMMMTMVVVELARDGGAGVTVCPRGYAMRGAPPPS